MRDVFRICRLFKSGNVNKGQFSYRKKMHTVIVLRDFLYIFCSDKINYSPKSLQLNMHVYNYRKI